MKKAAAPILAVFHFAWVLTAQAYPLDAAEETGINRLTGYQLI